MYVLGLWDGHDAGAALLRHQGILFAVNEERLSRRKLDVGFPTRSIEACLRHAEILPQTVHTVALSTTDPAKTLTRFVPGLKEQYYLLRRRKKDPGPLDGLRRAFKYRFTELGPNALSRRLTRQYAVKQLNRLGFKTFRLHLFDHHRCHARGAACFSGFNEALVLTLDGVGDGLSGALWDFHQGRLQQIQPLPASPSLGIFFEHVTRLLNMRELEDEGKVMALANYAFPVADRENPLLKILQVRGLTLYSPYSATALFRKLKRILWRFPSEQFACMAQRVLEKRVLELVRNAQDQTGHRNLCLAGGLFSNIKVNMAIQDTSCWDHVSVFPHMGDGGLALGAAMAADHRVGISPYPTQEMYLGPSYPPQDYQRSLAKRQLPYRVLDRKSGEVAEILLKGEIILWFQGRMEIGPRALGNRSILARPDRPDIKDRLNRVLKKRVWYQPFCPSILMEDALSLLQTKGRSVNDNRFMTTAFRVRPEYLPLLAGVINIDGTCRPHLVGDENPEYRNLLQEIKKRLGKGVLLNTSFNLHGEPMVCSPEDALDMFERIAVQYLVLGDFLVEKSHPAAPMH